MTSITLVKWRPQPRLTGIRAVRPKHGAGQSAVIGVVGWLCRYYATTIVGLMRTETDQDLYVLVLQLAPTVVKQRQQQQQAHQQGQQHGQLAQPVQADANIAVVNWLFGISSVSEWNIAPQGFIQMTALVQQGIREVAAHPGLPSAWPMLLWRMASLVNTCVERGTVSPALTLTVASATTTALLRGVTQLLCASPPLATETGVAARGAASEAEAAWAASTALLCIYCAFAAVSMAHEVSTAAEAAATLVNRCSALVTSPSAAGALQQRLHWLARPYSYRRCLSSAASAYSLLVYSRQASADVVAQYVTARLSGCAPRPAIDALPGVQSQVLALATAVSLPGRLRTQAAESSLPPPPDAETFYEFAKLLAQILDLVQGAGADADSSWAETPAAALIVLTASALMSFAEHDGRGGTRSAKVDVTVPGCMQLAAAAASCLASLAHRLRPASMRSSRGRGQNPPWLPPPGSCCSCWRGCRSRPPPWPRHQLCWPRRCRHWRPWRRATGRCECSWQRVAWGGSGPLWPPPCAAACQGAWRHVSCRTWML